MAHSLHVCTHCVMCHGVWMSRGQSWFAPSVCGNPGIETRLLGLTASAFTHRVIILGTETDFLWTWKYLLFSSRNWLKPAFQGLPLWSDWSQSTAGAGCTPTYSLAPPCGDARVMSAAFHLAGPAGWGATGAWMDSWAATCALAQSVKQCRALWHRLAL